MNDNVRIPILICDSAGNELVLVDRFACVPRKGDIVRIDGKARAVIGVDHGVGRKLSDGTTPLSTAVIVGEPIA